MSAYRATKVVRKGVGMGLSDPEAWRQHLDPEEEDQRSTCGFCHRRIPVEYQVEGGDGRYYHPDCLQRAEEEAEKQFDLQHGEPGPPQEDPPKPELAKPEVPPPPDIQSLVKSLDYLVETVYWIYDEEDPEPIDTMGALEDAGWNFKHVSPQLPEDIRADCEEVLKAVRVALREVRNFRDNQRWGNSIKRFWGPVKERLVALTASSPRASLHTYRIDCPDGKVFEVVARSSREAAEIAARASDDPKEEWFSENGDRLVAWVKDNCRFHYCGSPAHSAVALLNVMSVEDLDGLLSGDKRIARTARQAVEGMR